MMGRQAEPAQLFYKFSLDPYVLGPWRYRRRLTEFSQKILIPPVYFVEILASHVR